MKKLILVLCVGVMLFAYTPVKAEITQADLTAQLEVLKQQLIDELLKQIAVLQVQITEILAAQASLETRVQVIEAPTIEETSSSTPPVAPIMSDEQRSCLAKGITTVNQYQYKWVWKNDSCKQEYIGVIAPTCSPTVSHSKLGSFIGGCAQP